MSESERAEHNRALKKAHDENAGGNVEGSLNATWTLLAKTEWTLISVEHHDGREARGRSDEMVYEAPAGTEA